MSMNRDNTASVLSPEQIHELVTKPFLDAATATVIGTVVPTNAMQLRVPIITADPDSTFVAEGAEIDITATTVGEVVATPAKVAALSVLTSELVADSEFNALEIVGNGLIRSLASQTDHAFFTADVGGETPPGIADVTGVNEIAAGAVVNTDAFAEAVNAAESVGASLSAFVCNPATALKLAQLKQGDGSNLPLLGSDPTTPTRKQIQGVPLMVNRYVADNTVWGVDKRYTIIALRKDAELITDYSAFFTSDRVAVRAIQRVAFAFPFPESIQKITLSDPSS